MPVGSVPDGAERAALINLQERPQQAGIGWHRKAPGGSFPRGGGLSVAPGRFRSDATGGGSSPTDIEVKVSTAGTTRYQSRHFENVARCHGDIVDFWHMVSPGQPDGIPERAVSRHTCSSGLHHVITHAVIRRIK